jgi:inosine-uridine nucleoside N-ribohydrolase
MLGRTAGKAACGGGVGQLWVGSGGGACCLFGLNLSLIPSRKFPVLSNRGYSDICKSRPLLEEMRPIIIITDAALLGDDGIAITMLTSEPRLNVCLIVATAGNVWAEEAAENVSTLMIRLRLSGIDICIGAPSSNFDERRRAFAVRLVQNASSFYCGALGLNVPTNLGKVRLCDDLFNTIVAADLPDLVVIGPATVLASIIKQHVNLGSYVRHTYLVGGKLQGYGNATPEAEFNFWFDPEAAETVLASNLPLTLLPYDAVRGLRYSKEFASVLDSGHPAASYVLDCIERNPPPPICDEVLAAIVINPDLIVRSRKLKLAVEVSPGIRYGALNVLDDDVDRRAVRVIEEISQSAFLSLERSIIEMDDKEPPISKT